MTLLEFAHEFSDAELAADAVATATEASEVLATERIAGPDWEQLEGLLAQRTSEVDFDCQVTAIPAGAIEHLAVDVRVHHLADLGDRLVLTGSMPGGQMRVVLPRGAPGTPMAVQVRFQPDRGALPRDQLPLLELLDVLHGGARLRIQVPAVGLVLESPSVTPSQGEDHQAAVLWAVRALARIQRSTGASFPVPDVLTSTDEQALRRAVRLLDGEEVTGRWDDLTVGFDTLEHAQQALASFGGGSGYLRLVTAVEIAVAGEVIDLGLGVHHFHQVRASNADLDETDTGVQLTLYPGDDASFDLRLVEPDESAPPVLRRPSEMELRVHAGRWIATIGPVVVIDGDSPAEVVAWLREHGTRASVWRVPPRDADPTFTPLGL